MIHRRGLERFGLLPAAFALLVAGGLPVAPAPLQPLSGPTPGAAAAGSLPEAPGPAVVEAASSACPPASGSQPLSIPAGPLLRPAGIAPAAASDPASPGLAAATPGAPATASAAAAVASAAAGVASALTGAAPLQVTVSARPSVATGGAAEVGPDYRERLATTPRGWPILPRWCVWVEPPAAAGADRFEALWLEAVDKALAQWQQLLPIQRVAAAGAAQVRILRQRPPRLRGADGRLRASHGRATLSLLLVERQGLLREEPAVVVQLSPGQRPAALQATALHELGHAFGLWGHSDQAGDALAAMPGADPVLQLSRRDRATLRWLYAQPSRFGQPSR